MQKQYHYELRALGNGKYVFLKCDPEHPESAELGYPDLTEAEVRQWYNKNPLRIASGEVVKLSEQEIDDRLRVAQQELAERKLRA